MIRLIKVVNVIDKLVAIKSFCSSKKPATTPIRILKNIQDVSNPVTIFSLTRVVTGSAIRLTGMLAPPFKPIYMLPEHF